MLYTVAACALFLGGADAFQAGALPSRSAVTRSASAIMQVAEAEVASPVALAKVRARAIFQCILRAAWLTLRCCSALLGRACAGRRRGAWPGH